GVADEARGDHRLRVHLAPLGERGMVEDLAEVDDPEPARELEVGEADLADAPEIGHLPALEGGLAGGAGTRAGALDAAPRGLAAAGADAAPDALAGLVLAGFLGDVVDHHDGDSVVCSGRFGWLGQGFGAAPGAAAPPSPPLSVWASRRR